MGEIRRGPLDHLTAGNANPEAIGRITPRGLALVEAQEQNLAKSLAAGAEAADRIQQQEFAAFAILTCAWNGCNERATMRCTWCHQVTYCGLEYQNLNLERHGVKCLVRAMYR